MSAAPQIAVPFIPSAAPGDAGFWPTRLARIGEALSREIGQGRLPGAVVAIARGGKLAMLEAYGFRDVESRAPMTTDSVFSIASMTKPMVSAVTLALVEEGRLCLADPIAKHLPQLAGLRVAKSLDTGPLETVPASRPPTVQDLLRHTSGMTYPDRGSTAAHKSFPTHSMFKPDLTKEAFLEQLGGAALLYQPGTTWEYGLSTDVLGLVVEAVVEHTLGVAMAERLWRPLGMDETGFALTEGQRLRYAHCLPKDPLTGNPQKGFHAKGLAPSWESGGGGTVSTAVDYLRFLEALRRGGALGDARVLGRRTVAHMTSDHLAPGSERRIADTMDPSCEGYGFGLGFAVRRQDGIAAIHGSAGDYYWSGVTGTYFWVDPAEELSVVFLAAAPGLIRLHYRQLMRALVYQALA